MKVTKITIGRLFSLGNYEHVRYELTVECEWDQAPTAFRSIENILEALNPKKPHGYHGAKELELAENRIRDLHELTDEQVRHIHGQSKYSLIVKWQNQLRENSKRSYQWDRRREFAISLLNDLGGASEFKDAKQDWDDTEI